MGCRGLGEDWGEEKEQKQRGPRGKGGQERDGKKGRWRRWARGQGRLALSQFRVCTAALSALIPLASSLFPLFSVFLVSS